MAPGKGKRLTQQQTSNQDHCQIKVVSLSGREAVPRVVSIMRHAIGSPSADKVQSVSQMYKADPKCHLWGLSLEGNLASILGAEEISDAETRIRHIATIAGERNHGYASELIRHLLTNDSIKVIWAETSQDAVGFYERNGFEIKSIGEQWPGIERFRCTWQR